MTLRITVRCLSSPTTTLLQDQHLDIPAGTVHTLMGASGSGKSTLLAEVCGTLPDGMAFDGEIALDRHRIDTLPPGARCVGILFQENQLFVHMPLRARLRVLLFTLVKARNITAMLVTHDAADISDAGQVTQL